MIQGYISIIKDALIAALFYIQNKTRRSASLPFFIIIFSPYSFIIENSVSEEFNISNLSNVVGELTYAYAEEEDTLLDIARRFDVGHDQIIKANPTVNRWVPGKGTRIVIPSRYVLPSGVRDGIYLNLPEHRLYYFPTTKGQDSAIVETFPVSIGRMDWKTPLGATKIIKKDRDPVWTPPKSIRIEHEIEGDILPEYIPGGDPENPLGRYALRLGIPGYLIHGTDDRKAFGIGMQVTHGCVRMYPEDIERLFNLVAVGTKVVILDEGIKVGLRDERLYLEVHKPLDPDEDEFETVPTIDLVIDLIEKNISPNIKVDLEAVRRVYNVGNGVATIVGGYAPESIN